MEFPPHKLSQETPRINERKLDLLDPDFGATVHDYAELAKTSLTRGAGLSADQDHRAGLGQRPAARGQGLVLHDATPAKYQAWLEQARGVYARNPFLGEQIVCVNAWNEWAEGAFLEPDVHFGAAFLNATGARVVRGHGESRARHVARGA